MNKKNCPNCAAPYDSNLDTCPYCGTSYFDFSFLDFENRKPFYMKVKTIMNGKECYITQKCIPMLEDMEMTYDTYDCVDYRGNVINKICGSKQLTTNVKFVAVPDNKNNMVSIQLSE